MSIIHRKRAIDVRNSKNVCKNAKISEPLSKNIFFYSFLYVSFENTNYFHQFLSRNHTHSMCPIYLEMFVLHKSMGNITSLFI